MSETTTSPTAARVHTRQDSHWYKIDGSPCYELPKKDGKGMKRPTLADARKLNLLPGVTTILRVLHKEALVNWMIEQACLAVLTTPKAAEEGIDAFVERVLRTEEIQNEERDAAAELGRRLHEELENLANGQPPGALNAWVKPAWDHVLTLGKPVKSELVIVGLGYAGKTDLLLEAPDGKQWLIDYKSTKKLPDKGSWPEHRLQLAAYAAGRSLVPTSSPASIIQTGNLYISSVEPGKFVFFENPPWQADYFNGFSPLLTFWQWSTGYRPEQVTA